MEQKNATLLNYTPFNSIKIKSNTEIFWHKSAVPLRQNWFNPDTNITPKITEPHAVKTCLTSACRVLEVENKTQGMIYLLPMI